LKTPLEHMKLVYITIFVHGYRYLPSTRLLTDLRYLPKLLTWKYC